MQRGGHISGIKTHGTWMVSPATFPEQASGPGSVSVFFKPTSVRSSDYSNQTKLLTTYNEISHVRCFGEKH